MVILRIKYTYVVEFISKKSYTRHAARKTHVTHIITAKKTTIRENLSDISFIDSNTKTEKISIIYATVPII